MPTIEIDVTPDDLFEKGIATNKRFPVLIQSIVLKKTNVLVRFYIPQDVPDDGEAAYAATVRSRILEAFDLVAAS